MVGFVSNLLFHMCMHGHSLVNEKDLEQCRDPEGLMSNLFLCVGCAEQYSIFA